MKFSKNDYLDMLDALYTSCNANNDKPSIDYIYEELKKVLISELKEDNEKWILTNDYIEKDIPVFATVVYRSFKENILTIALYDRMIYTDDKWQRAIIGAGYKPIDKDVDVIAWMPYPKPYRLMAKNGDFG